MELNGVPNDVIHNINPFTLLMYVAFSETSYSTLTTLTYPSHQLHPHLRQILLPPTRPHGNLLHTPQEDSSWLRMRHAQHGRRCCRPTLHLCQVPLRHISQRLRNRSRPQRLGANACLSPHRFLRDLRLDHRPRVRVHQVA
jgi:hypothetical protein